jgi:hypothetical protein
MRKLLETMHHTHEIVVASWDLGMPLDVSREVVLRKLSLQTIECAYSIRDQSKITNFCTLCKTHVFEVFTVIIQGIVTREML